MRAKNLFIVMAIVVILVLSSSLMTLQAKDDGLEDWEKEGDTKKKEDKDKKDEDKELGEFETEKTVKWELNETLRAAGSFLRETDFTQLSAAFNFSYLSRKPITGMMFDFSLMFEYSLKEEAEIPITAFAQIGAGLHTLDNIPLVGSDSEFHIMALWLGGKYRFLDGSEYANLYVNFMTAFGLGFDADNGYGMWISQK